MARGFRAASSRALPSLWGSVDVRYAFSGDTYVNGTDQNSSQQSLALGSEASWALSTRQSLELCLPPRWCRRTLRTRPA